MSLITIDDVRAAAARIAGVAHRTPVVTSATLDGLVGASVHLKCENLQRGGAFKFRGAYNRMSRLSETELATGVFAFSSGNHAQAVAIAAGLLGTSATILMPEDAPAAKVAATRGYGAEIVTYDRYTQDREALGTAMADERGLVLIPPYEHPLVMAGQGTTGLELVEDAGDLDLFLCCIGGGGLMAGCSTAVRALSPGARIVGIEPAAANDTQRSLAAGERVDIGVPRTIADGLQANVPGELTFSVNRRTVDEIVTVTDAQIVEAMRFAFERLKLVVEPSGAVGIAALLSGVVQPAPGARVGVVISGGNIGAGRFAELVG